MASFLISLTYFSSKFLSKMNDYLNETIDILIIGGGAAGFFTAINAAERNPKAKIVILEQGKKVLHKVRISGGGRCNVTHAEFLPRELSKHYPRGEKELLGPFHSFMTGDVMQWFEERGVALKIEADGRVFPESDSSESIINCFLEEVDKKGIQVLKNQKVEQLSRKDENWKVQTKLSNFTARKLVMATGSNPKVWKLLEGIGHKTVAPVPSLFTFNINDKRIENIPGIASAASIKVVGTKLQSEGPLLITHWGMSGPAILKLSAWGARVLKDFAYHFQIQVNWLVNARVDEVLEQLKTLKAEKAKKQVSKHAEFDLPKRLWQSLVDASGVQEDQTWANCTKSQLQALAKELTQSVFQVHGKSTFKEEFVTAGGLDLKEIDFKTFASKIHKDLYFAGEVLNIDAITGGFNFQNAWTGGFLVAEALGNETNSVIDAKQNRQA